MKARVDEFRKLYNRFYAKHSSLDELLRQADETSSFRTPLCGSIFTINNSIDHLVRQAAKGRPRLHGFAVSGEELILVEVPVTSADGARRLGTAKVFLWHNPRLSVAFLLGLKEDFDILWPEFQRYFHAEITAHFLGTKDFLQAFRLLSEESPRLAPQVVGFTAHVLDDQRIKTRREWFQLPKDYREFFGEFEEERQWLRSVEVISTSGENTRGRIRRDLTFSCQMGFRAFYENIIAATARVAVSKGGIFDKRAVATSPTHASRPIQISYESPVFEDKQQNHRLIAVLRKLPDAAVSVYHANPFLHASVMDYSDGSSYTLWITDNSVVTLVPEFKATPNSLARLCNHINENFGEGTVEEVKE